jgi:HAD superfamily hydrolase (TIGR01509 family)
MGYKAVIFDMDGTIIDTTVIWQRSTKALVESYGIKHTPVIEQQLGPQIHGLAISKSCRIIKDFFGLTDSVEAIVERKMAFAQHYYHESLVFMPGFLSFHKKLQELGIPMAIGTNADDRTVTTVDEALGLTKLFGQHVYAISCVGNKCKPDPAVFLHAAAMLQVKPTECIVFEDSFYGVTAAKQASMFCVGLAFTPSGYDFVKGADMVVSSYDAIALDHVLEQNTFYPRVVSPVLPVAP